MTPKKCLVVTDNPGRLGNLLFRHGHLLAYAIEYGHILLDYSFTDKARGLTRLSQTVCFGRPSLSVGVDMSYWAKLGLRCARGLQGAVGWDRGLGLHGLVYCTRNTYPAVVELDGEEFARQTKGARLLLLSGYVFRADHLFLKHAEAIRRQFAFGRRTIAEGDRFLERVRTPGTELVGVHMRHGDYKFYGNGRHFFTAAQYAQVMRTYAAHRSGRLQFIVCSDSPQRREDFTGLDVAVHDGDAYSALEVLSRCSALIGTNSTFVQVAAFLGKAPFYEIKDPELEARPDQFTSIEVLRQVDW